ncbi:hypothetical protein [Undibacterium sp. TJN19]|uniref:hypothetical protein n=1 Tax=Undibacterium sp. TJN19 TaxID=3413055 RepID=UPI003BF1F720
MKNNMKNSMNQRFIRIAVLWFAAGIMLGIYMGISHQHIDKQVHVHGLLLGWVSCALFALVHTAWPRLQTLRSAAVHFWLHNLGLVMLLTGLVIERREATMAGPFLGIGSITLAVATVIFTWNVWRVTTMQNNDDLTMKEVSGKLHHAHFDLS